MRDAVVPLTVAVVGSGPAGIYACESLLRHAEAAEVPIEVDLLERLPVPYGLLRYGVAPDHPRIKGIARVLSRILDEDGVHFLGGVQVGSDVTVAELREHYHAVVLATGALSDRRLNIAGADAEGVHGAAEFVTWYDGHPDAGTGWDLQGRRAAVVGVGNVALDVARMLLRTPAELEPTDIPDGVREVFKQNRTEHVTLLGRRGPWQAKFTPKELRELGKMDRVKVIVDPAALESPSEADAELRASERHVDQNLTQLETWAAETGPDPDAAEAAALAAGDRVMRFRFQAPPVEITTDDGRVRGLVIGNDDEQVELPVDRVYTAIGYRSSPVAEVPFDAESAVIPHQSGRVSTRVRVPDSDSGGTGGDDAVADDIVAGLYVAGWIKRGPTGVIGTNRSCAAETIDSLWVDVEAGMAPASDSRTGAHALPCPTENGRRKLRELLRGRGVELVDDIGRQAVSDHETELGERAGRERTKVASREELLAIARAAQEDAGLTVH